MPRVAVGKLEVKSSDEMEVSEAVLCENGRQVAKSMTDYALHDAAAAAQEAVDTVQILTASRAVQTAPGPSGSKSTWDGYVTDAADALETAATALNRFKADTSLTTNSTTVEDAVEAARAAAKDARDAIAVEGATANTAHGALNGLNTALMNIDEDLGDAADTIHMGFSLSTPIAPDAGPYVVVIATEADNPTIDVTFTGVLATDSAIGPGKNLATAQDTYNVMVWATHPGLFMIKTTGMELMVKGTFPSTTSTERKGQNVAWTVPIPADTAQTLTVDPQDRAERGEFGLMLGYMQAMELAEPSTAAPMPTADGELKTDMQTQYFFLASTKTQFLTGRLDQACGRERRP